MTTCVALIPARSGSKRIVDKNIRMLNGHPLLAYAIAAAQQSGVFTDVIVSTDSKEYLDFAHFYGARCILRPAEYATDVSPDIQWVRHTLQSMKDMLWKMPDCFAILRPTSPFRTAETIKRAWARWLEAKDNSDSMRAVELCSQHPYKMWEVEGNHIFPLMDDADAFYSPHHRVPGHSRQYASLPKIYVQNASLEIAWVKTVFDDDSIAGTFVAPFFTEGIEGMDVNRPQDWDAVELILQKCPTALPQIKRWEAKSYMDHMDDPWWHYRTPDGSITHLDKVGAAWERQDMRYLQTEGTDAIRKRHEEASTR